MKKYIYTAVFGLALVSAIAVANDRFGTITLQQPNPGDLAANTERLVQPEYNALDTFQNDRDREEKINFMAPPTTGGNDLPTTGGRPGQPQPPQPPAQPPKCDEKTKNALKGLHLAAYGEPMCKIINDALKTAGIAEEKIKACLAPDIDEKGVDRNAYKDPLHSGKTISLNGLLQLCKECFNKNIKDRDAICIKCASKAAGERERRCCLSMGKHIK
jgi:hypothetical protein